MMKQAQFDPQEANIFLVGLRGSGKTTLGRLVAERLALLFVDTDDVIVQQAGESIAKIVSKQGWDVFRSMEKEVLRDVCSRRGQVVATGGGVVLDSGNRELLETSGVVFYLMADIATLTQRLAQDPKTDQRPALSGLAMAQELVQCLFEREPLYMRIANHVLRAEKAPAFLVEEVLEKLGGSPRGSTVS
jgi:shikimate kinase